MRRNLPLIIVAVAALGVVVAFYQMKDHRLPDVQFITTPPDVVDAMVELAEVTESDMVYDLGCGDGRMVITAARKRGCRGLGIDIDPKLVEECRENARSAGVGDRVKFRRRDIFDQGLEDASVVMVFLTPGMNQQLIPQIRKMKPGSRIVSHCWSMPGVKPQKVIQVRSEEDGLDHRVYLWVTPLVEE